MNRTARLVLALLILGQLATLVLVYSQVSSHDNFQHQTYANCLVTRHNVAQSRRNWAVVSAGLHTSQIVPPNAPTCVAP